VVFFIASCDYRRRDATYVSQGSFVGPYSAEIIQCLDGPRRRRRGSFYRGIFSELVPIQISDISIMAANRRDSLE